MPQSRSTAFPWHKKVIANGVIHTSINWIKTVNSEFILLPFVCQMPYQHLHWILPQTQQLEIFTLADRDIDRQQKV